MEPQPVSITGPADLESRALEPLHSLGPERSDYVSDGWHPRMQLVGSALHRLKEKSLLKKNREKARMISI